MSTHNRSASAPLGRAHSGRIGVAAALLMGITAHVPTAFAQQGPGLGQPISPADLAPWNIDVGTDGKELPPGSGKAKAGAAIYAAKCQTCHGADGKGQPADQLVGGEGTIDKFDQVRTVGSYWPYATTIFDYVRRAMPFNTPETLTNDEAYALTAYLLYKNGIIKENDEMSARTLARVRMPNVNGFIYEYPPKPAK
jgi:mono/diheme cytochrome c family protein